MSILPDFISWSIDRHCVLPHWFQSSEIRTRTSGKMASADGSYTSMSFNAASMKVWLFITAILASSPVHETNVEGGINFAVKIYYLARLSSFSKNQ